MEGVLNIELGGTCQYKYYNNILELDIRNDKNNKSNYFNICKFYTHYNLNINVECLVLKKFSDEVCISLKPFPFI